MQTVGRPYPCTVVSVDVGGTKIAGALVSYDAAGAPTVCQRRQVPTDAQDGGDAVLDKVCAMVRDLLEQQRPCEAAAEVRSTEDAEGAANPAGPAVVEGAEGAAGAAGAAAGPAVVERAEDAEGAAGAAGATAGSAATSPVVGIGVSTAGSVDEKSGSIAFANDIMPGWMGQPVGARLETEFGLPVAVLNDVHAHALGELRHGAARGTSTAIVVAAGTGLGGAIVVDGRVAGGAHGFAGMLGHTLHHSAEGLRCACGVEGHLECVASGSGIEACYQREIFLSQRGSIPGRTAVAESAPGTSAASVAAVAAQAPASSTPDAPNTAGALPPQAPSRMDGSGVWDCTPMAGGNPVSGAEIARLAREGDPVARKVVETAGRSLGEAIASWAGILDPEVAVVSGSVTKAGPIWRSALKEGFADRLGPEFQGRLPIVDAALGDNAPLIGAAERLLDKLA